MGTVVVGRMGGHQPPDMVWTCKIVVGLVLLLSCRRNHPQGPAHGIQGGLVVGDGTLGILSGLPFITDIGGMIVFLNALSPNKQV